VCKCTLCLPRLKEGKLPGCVEACPMDALTFGKRAALLKLAKKRIAAHPDVYKDHVYGELEAGGTNWLYISGAPFSQVGLDESVINRPYAELTAGALGAVPMVIGIWPVLLGGAYMISKRREAVAREEIHEAVEAARAEVKEAADKKLAAVETANTEKLAKIEAEAAQKVAAAEAAAAKTTAAAPKRASKGAKKSEGEDA
jgi:hypothetical protein